MLAITQTRWSLQQFRGLRIVGSLYAADCALVVKSFHCIRNVQFALKVDGEVGKERVVGFVSTA